MPRARMDEARQEEILSALAACILERGLLQTSLNDVAEKAGLARPLVRHFVGNRDEMIERLFEQLIDRGEKQLEALNSAERANATAIAGALRKSSWLSYRCHEARGTRAYPRATP